LTIFRGENEWCICDRGIAVCKDTWAAAHLGMLKLYEGIVLGLASLLVARKPQALDLEDGEMRASS